MYWRRKWQPTPVSLPGESQGRGSLVGCRLWGLTESDTTEVTQQQQQAYRQHPFSDELVRECRDSSLLQYFKSIPKILQQNSDPGWASHLRLGRGMAGGTEWLREHHGWGRRAVGIISQKESMYLDRRLYGGQALLKN